MSRTITSETKKDPKAANAKSGNGDRSAPANRQAQVIWFTLLLLGGIGLGWLATIAIGDVIGWMKSDPQKAETEVPQAAKAANDIAPPVAGSPQPKGVPTACCSTGEDKPEPEAPSAPSTPPAGVSPKVNDAAAPGPAPEGMVWIPGGIYWRGNDTQGHRDSRPWHLVEVDGFWMDATPVTNEQFEKFVKATGYVTVAEKAPRAEDFPGAPPENLVAGSVVFTPPKGRVPLDNHLRWWNYVKGANWRHPEGPDSDLKGKEKHPVVHVAHEDAQAYCKWAGKRLPTEAEFEFAARGGLDRNKYSWGNEFKPNGKWMANIWQGKFPYENTMDDGYRLTSPVGSFPANGFKLHDVAGNVWQWCADWYRHDTYAKLAAQPQPVHNPQGPGDSVDPSEPGVAKRVMRGGSYLCTDQYCTAYEAGARGKGAPDTGTSHLGFRCVKSVK